MKKMLCIILALSMVMTLFSTAAYAVGCLHENSVHDASYDTEYRYTDCGDYHEKVVWEPMICLDCLERFWVRDQNTYVEGHNLVLVSFDRTHNPDNTHAYTFRCMDCKRTITIFGSCGGPPCEAIYLPWTIKELLSE